MTAPCCKHVATFLTNLYNLRPQTKAAFDSISSANDPAHPLAHRKHVHAVGRGAIVHAATEDVGLSVYRDHHVRVQWRWYRRERQPRVGDEYLTPEHNVHLWGDKPEIC